MVFEIAFRAGFFWRVGARPQAIASETVINPARHLEVVLLAIAFVQDERPVVGDGIPFERRDLSDRRNFCALGYLLFVQDLFGQPDHRITGFAWIPKDAFCHRAVIEELTGLVRRGRSDHHRSLDMLFSHGLSSSTCTLAPESQESIQIW